MALASDESETVISGRYFPAARIGLTQANRDRASFVASRPMRQPARPQSRAIRAQQCFCRWVLFAMPSIMINDRMMQAIGSLERAIARLEQSVAALPADAAGLSGVADPAGARAALQSLDDLITELRGRTGG